MVEYLRDLISKSKTGDKYGKLYAAFIFCITSCASGCLTVSKFHVAGSYTLQFADDFTYTDPVSQSSVHVPFFS